MSNMIWTSKGPVQPSNGYFNPSDKKKVDALPQWERQATKFKAQDNHKAQQESARKTEDAKRARK